MMDGTREVGQSLRMRIFETLNRSGHSDAQNVDRGKNEPLSCSSLYKLGYRNVYIHSHVETKTGGPRDSLLIGRDLSLISKESGKGRIA